MKLSWILKGAAMGVAEVIPGVSGGTIAFITGIYEKLINNIANIDLKLIGVVKNDGIKGLKDKFDFAFIFSLGLGMVLGFISTVFSITYLKDNFPIQLTSVFFGLILGSVVYISKKVDKWSVANILAMIFMFALSYYVTVMNPIEADGNLIYIFVCGSIAISALMLPGVSGSLLLLMLGAYYIVLPAVKSLLSGDMSSLNIVIAFGTGCLVGVLTIAKLLKYAFNNYKDFTLSAMTGLMIGSLNKLWPWQNVLSTRVNSKGVEVPFQTESVSFSNFIGEPYLLGAAICCVLGLLLVLLLSKFEVKEEK